MEFRKTDQRLAREKGIIKQLDKRKYSKISFDDRCLLIEQVCTGEKSIRKAARSMKMNFSTAKAIVKNFRLGRRVIKLQEHEDITEDHLKREKLLLDRFPAKTLPTEEVSEELDDQVLEEHEESKEQTTIHLKIEGEKFEKLQNESLFVQDTTREGSPSSILHSRPVTTEVNPDENLEALRKIHHEKSLIMSKIRYLLCTPYQPLIPVTFYSSSDGLVNPSQAIDESQEVHVKMEST